MMTFLAPPLVMWFSAPWTVLPFLLTPSFLIVKRPVDSTTISTPISPHGILPGSVSLNVLTGLPSISKPFFLNLTVPSKRP